MTPILVTPPDRNREPDRNRNDVGNQDAERANKLHRGALPLRLFPQHPPERTSAKSGKTRQRRRRTLDHASVRRRIARTSGSSTTTETIAATINITVTAGWSRVGSGDDQGGGDVAATRPEQRRPSRRPVGRAEQPSHAHEGEQVQRIGRDRETSERPEDDLQVEARPAGPGAGSEPDWTGGERKPAGVPARRHPRARAQKPIPSGISMRKRSGLAIAHGSRLQARRDEGPGPMA